jgi:hypothetical protein
MTGVAGACHPIDLGRARLTLYVGTSGFSYPDWTPRFFHGHATG